MLMLIPVNGTTLQIQKNVLHRIFDIILSLFCTHDPSKCCNFQHAAVANNKATDQYVTFISQIIPWIIRKVVSPSHGYTYVYASHSDQHCVALLLCRRTQPPPPSCSAVRQLACDNSSFVATIYLLVCGVTHRVHNTKRTATWSETNCPVNRSHYCTCRVETDNTYFIYTYIYIYGV